jgi:hypothetical protein
VSPDVARRGLACHSAAAIMAGRGPTWPCACGRWLPVWLPESRSNENVNAHSRRPTRERRPGIPDRARRGHLLRGHRPLRQGPRRPAWTSTPISATGPSNCPSPTPRRPHDSNHVRQPPPRTSRLSRHGCDSAFPPGTTHRQTDHGPCTCRTHITAARDGHPASVATA